MKTKTASIEQYIISNISSGTFLPGFRIPSQHKLTQQFNCSRVTVLRALNNLCKQGFLESARGKGTFVSTSHSGHPLKEIIVISEYEADTNSFPYAEIVLNLNCDLPVRWINHRFLARNSESFFSAGQVVIWMLPPESQITLMHNLRQRGIPQILINRTYGDFNHITIDPWKSIEEGLKAIFANCSKKQRKIAILSRHHGAEAPYLAERLIAFYEVCAAQNITIPPGWLYKTEYRDLKQISAYLEKIFAEQKKMPYRTFFIPEDTPISSAVLAASRHGLVIGRDFGILAFSQGTIIPPQPGFTALYQPMERYRHHVEEFIRLTRDGVFAPYRVKMKADLLTGD